MRALGHARTLRCPQCSLRCTRLYLPLNDSWLACRRCWGRTFPSRTLQNYKDSPWGRGMFARLFGTTQRDWAFGSPFPFAKNRETRAVDAEMHAITRRHTRLVRRVSYDAWITVTHESPLSLRGQRGARAAAWRGGDRRQLGRRATGRSARQSAAQGPKSGDCGGGG